MDARTDQKRAIHAWCMYDWASSAFATTIMAAMFPPFYRALVTSGGMSAGRATAYWGYTASLALLVIALAAPILGAVADHMGCKRRFLACFAGFGILATAVMPTIGESAWGLASLLFIAGHLGFSGANIFYESLLPHVAGRERIDQVSARGYALGYVGGGMLLIINALWVMKPATFGMPDEAFAIRASFFSVALWWGLFSIPLFRHVPEPPRRILPGADRNPIREGFSRLANTFNDLQRYRQLLTFLVAFWIYNDGIGTIVKMSTAYGSEIGLQLRDMVLALVITQFIGIPCAILFGRLAKRIGAKRSVLLALSVYVLICCGAYFMRTATHFYILAFGVGMVLGGSQALSRSLFGAMVPHHKTGEFFGFFSTSGKLAGIAGPLLFGLFSQFSSQSRISILFLVVFFIAGGIVLTQVDVEKGVRVARAAEDEAAAWAGSET